MRGGSFKIHEMPDGKATVSVRAVEAAVRHALRDIGSPPSVAADHNRVSVLAVAPDAAAAAELEAAIGERLGVGFWIDLGIPDVNLDVAISIDPKPRPGPQRRVR
jgi:hypothetical protein